MNNVTVFLSSPSSSSMDPTTITAIVDEDPMEKTLSDIVEIYILVIFFVIGAPLNLISFYKLFQSLRRSRTGPFTGRISINLLRLNLNMADLMTIFIYTTSQIGWLTTRQWLGGDILCRIIKFFHTFVFYLVSFIIVCIAIDRVYGAYKLSSFKTSKKAYDRSKKFVIMAWTIAIILSIPQMIIFGIVEPPTMKGFFQCATVWMAERSILEEQSRNPFITEEKSRELYYEYIEIGRWEMAYNICHLLFVFWIPALVILSSYLSILCILNNFSRQSDVYDEIKSKQSCFSMFCPSSKIINKSTIKKESTTSIGNSPEYEQNSSNSLPNLIKIKLHENDGSLNNKLHVNPFFDDEQESKSEHLENGCLLDDKKEKLGFRRSQSEQFKILSTRGSGNTLSGAMNTIHERSSSRVGTLALQTIAIARAKTKRQAALILIAYLTLWTPYNILAIINIFVPPESRGSILNQIMVIMPFTNSLIVVNAIVNPLIYGVFDRTT